MQVTIELFKIEINKYFIDGSENMAKRKVTLTEKKIMQMEKEGRGQGIGGSYKPWITIQDFPS